MKNKKLFKLILLLFWCLFIFIMSSFDSDISSSQSGFFTNIIVDIFKINNSTTLSLLIRKIAHITEYFILFLLSINWFNEIIKKPLIVSILFSVLYACSDEFHQLFVSGRGASITDVFIDCIGVFIGTIIYLVLKNRKKT